MKFKSLNMHIFSREISRASAWRKVCPPARQRLISHNIVSAIWSALLSKQTNYPIILDLSIIVWYIMVFCAAYRCNSRHKKGCGLSFFSFPKEVVRRKTWTIYCRRDVFVPTKNSRLCSLHFSKEQVARDPEKMKENSYVGAQIRLRADAVTSF